MTKVQNFISSLRFKVSMNIIPFYFCNLTYIFTRIVGFIYLELVWMVKSVLMGDLKLKQFSLFISRASFIF